MAGVRNVGVMGFNVYAYTLCLLIQLSLIWCFYLLAEQVVHGIMSSYIYTPLGFHLRVWSSAP